MRLFALAFLMLCSCATVTTIDGKPIDTSLLPDTCDVRIYQTYNAAIAQGQIKEICVVSGQSFATFDHSVATAVAQNKHRLCACGATDAYIQSRQEISFLSGPATVTLVGFRYVPNKNASQSHLPSF